jgi:hypothetical protein
MAKVWFITGNSRRLGTVPMVYAEPVECYETMVGWMAESPKRVT